MRINNPKSLAGFTIADSANDQQYKLATIGQVQTAFNRLNTKFSELLQGTAAPSGVTGAGYGGFVNRAGYAWLNTNGKVDPSLLPALAITETYVVKQTDLNSAYSTDVYAALNECVTVGALSNTLEGGVKLQKGDIIIITPDETVSSISTQDIAIPSGETRELTNPSICGTYIVTAVPGDRTAENPEGIQEYMFAKMAYTDSHIVTINGCSPTGSNGLMTMKLFDILKVKKYAAGNFVNNDEGAEVLEDRVYRIAAVDDGDDGVRFAFIDKTANDVAEVVPYARLRELQAEADIRAFAVDELSAAINNLTAHSDAQDAFLSSSIDGITTTIGNTDDVGVKTADGTLRAQLNSLRTDVDHNADVLLSARMDTVTLVNKLQDNINYLYDNLNGKAVSIIEKEITWGDENTSHSELNDPVSFNETITLNGDDGQELVLTSGSVMWTYTYVPSEIGQTIDKETGTIYQNSSNVQANGLSSIFHVSDEKIIGVYDAEGNEVCADIKRVNVNGITQSEISVVLDNIGKDGDVYRNSPIGQKWTLLIAKRIVGTPMVELNSNSYTTNFTKSSALRVAGILKEWKTGITADNENNG